MQIPAVFGHKVWRMEDLHIVSRFKGSGQSLLVCMLHPDAIVRHRPASIDVLHIKRHGRYAAGRSTGVIQFVRFHKELLTEVLIICSIRRWRAGLGIYSHAIADLNHCQTFLHHGYIESGREVIIWILIPGHHDLSIKCDGTRLRGSPVKYKFLILHGV